MRVQNPRIRWWKLKGEHQIALKNKLLIEGPWQLDDRADKMWKEISTCIQRVAREVLGESKGIGGQVKETWWWNEEVQEAIKRKKECFKGLHKCPNEENLQKFRQVRKDTKKAVRNARGKVFDDMYKKPEIKEGEKDIYRLVSIRDKKSKDLTQVKCI